ncbi:release factor glutamine methyltransferase [Nonomuraea maritima]|uniref:Release factor glutamine methyltransferase n=1 Tax=Nonomuraea maritima TaxID=683260 RepID=A0A1G9KF56_9ACTN|nr:methyltransferase [Nonomuraea maritima]SDL48196.1 release factor glutamine methyltransferase [Nonomuraea maritima]
MPDDYVPTLPPERVEQIRRWHENAYRAAREEGAEEQTFAYLGRTIVVPPGVQPIAGMSHVLGEAVLAEVAEGDRVLDMGTGSGVNAVLAASKAAEVLAVDVSPAAVEAARRNAARNGVADRVEVRLSDVFSAVDGRFDLIVFDPPFRWFAPRDMFERASTDEGYRTMAAFFAGARDRLTPHGRMLVSFGTSGDLGHLRRLAGEAGFASETVATRSLVRDDDQVDYYTFRMTPK